MKYRKGDKIFWHSDPKKALEYDLILGVIDKKYYAMENYYRETTKHKFRKPNPVLCECEDYEYDIEDGYNGFTVKKGSK